MCKNQPKRVLHELQFNVAQLLKEVTGATRSYDIEIETIDRLREEVKIVSPLCGGVNFLRTGADILVTGALQTTVKKTCGRCLADFTAPVSLELEEEFYPSVDILTGALLPIPPEADEANRIDEHHILDLLEVVRQGFLLAADDIRYCRPDCKGLCPYCGQDRNFQPCDCQDNVIDQRWADLQKIEIED
jgi:uncharacterized protein